MRRRARQARIGVLVVCAVALAAGTASAQLQMPLGRQPLDPQGLEQPRKAPLTLIPTLTISEEFNDNVLLNNHDKRWDMITRFTPGVTLLYQESTARLAAGYGFNGEVYARNPGLNHAFDAHNFFLDGLWRPTSRWTLTAGDTFGFATSTNLINAEGVATGRHRSLGNGLSAGAAYQVTPRTTLRGSGTWGIQRFFSTELEDSNIYRGEIDVDHVFTPRFTGTLGFEIARFDIEHETKVTAYTPKLGFTYRLTEALTATVAAGPTIEVPDEGSTHIVPFANVSLRQRFLWGSAGVNYTEYIGVAGGLGGTTVNQSVGGSVEIITLMKGLIVDVGPRYTWIKSHDDRIDIRGFSLPVRAIWRFAAWGAVVASYTFFHQDVVHTIFSRTGQPLANDVDQNRVSVGLEVGYPIRFE